MPVSGFFRFRLSDGSDHECGDAAFISLERRPISFPSRISAAKGGDGQGLSPSGTTSMCRVKARLQFARAAQPGDY
jgi:hypothetical protein